MPQYDYACKSCPEIWTDTYPMKKAKVPCNKPCPHCNAKKGNVYRYMSQAPATKIYSNMDIKKPHNHGGFQDAMKRMVESPGVKGPKAAQIIKDKHIS